MFFCFFFTTVSKMKKKFSPPPPLSRPFQQLTVNHRHQLTPPPPPPPFFFQQKLHNYIPVCAYNDNTQASGPIVTYISTSSSPQQTLYYLHYYENELNSLSLFCFRSSLPTIMNVKDTPDHHQQQQQVLVVSRRTSLQPPKSCSEYGIQ